MNDLIQKLATFAPALIAQMKGDPVALEEFTKGYQSTMAQLEEKKLRDQQMTLGMEDRQRMITRQTEQDRIAEDARRIAQEERDYGKSRDAIEMLSKFVPAQDTMGGAETMSQSIMARVPEHLREGVAGVADQQLRQQPQMITDRQRKQAEAFLEKWEKSPRKPEFDSAEITADQIMIPLPEHLAGYLKKPQASLAELQQFAQLPVGKPAGKPLAEKPDFTLGNTRYKADGTPIITAPEKPTGGGADKTPDQIFVIRNGVVTPITKGTAQPGDLPYSERNQGNTRPVTAGDTKDIADINEALELARSLNFKPSDTGILPYVGAKTPDAVTNITGFGVGAKQRQGMINLVKQIIGKGLEGGVLRKEDEYKYEKMLPTMSDHPDVAKTKVANMIATLKDKRTVRLDAMRDAGYDVSKFDERASGSGGGGPKFTIGQKVKNKQTGEMGEVTGIQPDGKPIIKPVSR